MTGKHKLKRAGVATMAAVCIAVGGGAGSAYAVGVSAEHRQDQPTQAQNGQGHSKAKGKAAKGEGKAAKGKSSEARSHRTADRPSQSQGDPNLGEGHTPVTVCHLLGNGSYILLTFDDNALKAHEGHGDLYPVPAEGCPDGDTGTASTPDKANGVENARVTVCHVLGNGSYNPLTFDDDALEAHIAHGDLYPMPAAGCSATDTGTSIATTGDLIETDTSVTSTQTTQQPEVLGVEQVTTRMGTATPAKVLGAEAVAGGPGVPGAVDPVAGILPQTGAGQVGLALAAGTVLLGAGGLVLARRRQTQS